MSKPVLNAGLSLVVAATGKLTSEGYRFITALLKALGTAGTSGQLAAWDANGDLVGTSTPTISSLTFSPTTNGIVGTTAANDAAAGYVGEYIESAVAVGSAVSLTTGTGADITSISLTAGDWDVEGEVAFNTAATTSLTRVTASIATGSGLINSVTTTTVSMVATVFGAVSTVQQLPVTRRRVNVSTTTTIYLVARGTFTVSTLTAHGYIGARRVR
jgi:hypothetical protein